MNMTRLFLHTRVALAIGLAAATIAMPVHAAPRAVEVDRTVAVVNSEVITSLQLRARIEQAKRQLARQGVELPPDNVLERQLLERLIVERAAAKKARNFAEADRIRDELKAAGIALDDSPQGTTWRRA